MVQEEFGRDGEESGDLRERIEKAMACFCDLSGCGIDPLPMETAIIIDRVT